MEGYGWATRPVWILDRGLVNGTMGVRIVLPDPMLAPCVLNRSPIFQRIVEELDLQPEIAVGSDVVAAEPPRVIPRCLAEAEI